ncbi:MAG TPA: polysaccharide biosynthesis C-terminal domain-containing protein, partial [Kofleriaceae bacterium]|nr:polysaccharide biosynthesis C-terminal domain-containing protein [Kofleriaceae bacterium]
VGYAVAIPVTVLSPWIITGLFGAAYERAAPMLTVLVWASVVTNLGIARSGFLTAMNWTRLHFASSVLAALANVLLNLWLIPRYGGVGAAIASLIAYWIGSQGTCLLFKPLRRTAWMMTKALLWPKIW